MSGEEQGASAAYGENEAVKVPGLDAEEGLEAIAPKVKDVSLKGKPEDIKTWITLAEDAAKASSRKARDLYEALLRRFPLAENYWVKYCQMELKESNYVNVDRILKRTLLTLESVDLWLFYLSYVMERKLGKDSEASKNPSLEKVARREVEEAFEFALKNIGFSYDAGQIWIEYIKFIESQKCDSQFDLTNRAVAVRTAYARAVKIPVMHLEAIWKGFEEKEKSIAAEVQQEYMKAKAVYLDRKNLYEGISCGDIPEPYSGDPTDERKLAKWKQILEFEKANPERTTDISLKRRVRHTYTKALSVLFFYPEVWYDFYQYELDTNDPISSKIILEKAMHAIPDSLILHFAVADMHELQGRIEQAREIYAKLERKHPSSVVFIQSQQFERRVAGIASGRAVFRRARQSSACDSTVFIAAALLEFHNNKDPRVARNIFELGLKRFPKDVSFIVQYLRFLEHLNEDTDIITLYERALAQLDQKEAFPIWERYREFRARFVAYGGGLKMLAKLEKRMADAYPNRATSLKGFAGIIHRYAFLGQHPSLPSDVSFFERSKRLSLGPHARMYKGMPLAGGEAHGGGLSSGSYSTSYLDTVGEADDSKTPTLIRRLEALLPENLGDNVRPMPVEFMFSQIRNFSLPPKAVFAKKKRKLTVDNEDAEATDLFKKRRKNL